MLCLQLSDDDPITITVPPSAEPTTIKLDKLFDSHGRARIGFTAPRCVEIVREKAKPRTPPEEARALRQSELAKRGYAGDPK